jgi:hypothetical protein
MQTLLKNVALIVLGIVLIAAGIGMGWFTYDVTKTMIRGSDWVSAPATITYTYSAQPGGGRLTANFLPNYVRMPEYSFIAADGKTYTGNRNGILEFTSSSAPTVVQGEIFYDPENPNNSAVIKPKFEPFFPVIFAFFAVLLLMGGFSLLRHIIGRYRGKGSDQINTP